MKTRIQSCVQNNYHYLSNVNIVWNATQKQMENLAFIQEMSETSHLAMDHHWWQITLIFCWAARQRTKRLIPSSAECHFNYDPFAVSKGETCRIFHTNHIFIHYVKYRAYRRFHRCNLVWPLNESGSPCHDVSQFQSPLIHQISMMVIWKVQEGVWFAHCVGNLLWISFYTPHRLLLKPPSSRPSFPFFTISLPSSHTFIFPSCQAFIILLCSLSQLSVDVMHIGLLLTLPGVNVRDNCHGDQIRTAGWKCSRTCTELSMKLRRRRLKLFSGRCSESCKNIRK